MERVKGIEPLFHFRKADAKKPFIISIFKHA
jgi:phosphatidylglycerophosphatase A